MAGEIWLLVEQWRGWICDITYEVLALGREVAEALAGSLQAFVLGPGAGESVSSLGAADGALMVEHSALAEPVPEVYALALAQIIPQRQPRALLIPQTNVTMEMGPLLAARLAVPFPNFRPGGPGARGPSCGPLHPLRGQGRSPRAPAESPRRFRDSPRGAAAGTGTGGAGARSDGTPR